MGGHRFVESDFSDANDWGSFDCGSGSTGIPGQFVYIRLAGKNAANRANQLYLTLCEVEVFSAQAYHGVTRYSLQRSLDGKKWVSVKEDRKIQLFQGNFDRSTEVTNELATPATARYIRIKPVQCNGACAGNFEILGGPVESCQIIDNIALTGDEIVGYDQDGKTNQKWNELTYRVTAGDSDGIFCFPNPYVPQIYVCDSEGLDFETSGRISLTVTVSD